MADIATFWDAANVRGDWAITPPAPPPPGLPLLSDTGGLDLLAEDSEVFLADQAVASPSGIDLIGGQDLYTAVLISLFSDRTAAADDVITDGTTDPRGWWGDATPTGAAAVSPIGSRLWLLYRSKAIQATLLAAKGYIVEALQWLVDDGVAAAVDVFVEWTTPTMLGCRITLHQPAAQPKVFAFSNVWAQIS